MSRTRCATNLFTSQVPYFELTSANNALVVGRSQLELIYLIRREERWLYMGVMLDAQLLRLFVDSRLLAISLSLIDARAVKCGAVESFCGC